MRYTRWATEEIITDSSNAFNMRNKAAVHVEETTCVLVRPPFAVLQGERPPREFFRMDSRDTEQSLNERVAARGPYMGPAVVWLSLRPGLKKCFQAELDGKQVLVFNTYDGFISLG